MAASHKFEVSSPSLSKYCGPMDREQLLAHSKHLLEPGYHFSFVAWIDLLPRLHAVVAVFDSDEFASYIGFFPRLLKAQGIFKVHLRVRCTVNQQNRRHAWPGICNRRPFRCQAARFSTLVIPQNLERPVECLPSRTT